MRDGSSGKSAVNEGSSLLCKLESKIMGRGWERDKGGEEERSKFSKVYLANYLASHLCDYGQECKNIPAMLSC